MRELDVLLTSFLEGQYLNLDEPGKDAFRRVLALSDPELMHYLLGGEIPADQEIACVVSQIRGKTQA